MRTNHPRGNLMLIINPTAGKNRARSALFDIIELLFNSGYQVTVYPTQAKGDATRYIMEHAEQFENIVCVGGDGTLNEVVTGLMQLPPFRRRTLGYIPAGTTNDFASTLGLDGSDMLKCARGFADGIYQSCDIGRFGDRYFTYVAAFGAFTQVSYETPQEMKNALGHLAYIMEGIKSLPALHPYRLEIEADNELIEGDFFYGQITNSTSIGGIMDIHNAGVMLDDGLFEVMLIKMPANLIELSVIITALLNQKFTDCPHIFFHHAKRVIVRSKRGLPWTLDGEDGGTTTEAVAQCVPHAVTFRLPFSTTTAFLESERTRLLKVSRKPDEEADNNA
ncbi:MAG: diacylglycerol/lipid kinase family protein [Butyricicoccaceae bacterium]